MAAVTRSGSWSPCSPAPQVAASALVHCCPPSPRCLSNRLHPGCRQPPAHSCGRAPSQAIYDHTQPHLSGCEVLMMNGDTHAGPEVLMATKCLVLAGHIRAPDEGRSRSGPVRIGAPQPDGRSHRRRMKPCRPVDWTSSWVTAACSACSSAACSSRRPNTMRRGVLSQTSLASSCRLRFSCICLVSTLKRPLPEPSGLQVAVTAAPGLPPEQLPCLPS